MSLLKTILHIKLSFGPGDFSGGCEIGFEPPTPNKLVSPYSSSF